MWRLNALPGIANRLQGSPETLRACNDIDFFKEKGRNCVVTCEEVGED